jgi:hypothetical protein
MNDAMEYVQALARQARAETVAHRSVSGKVLRRIEARTIAERRPQFIFALATLAATIAVAVLVGLSADAATDPLAALFSVPNELSSWL